MGRRDFCRRVVLPGMPWPACVLREEGIAEVFRRVCQDKGEPGVWLTTQVKEAGMFASRGDCVVYLKSLAGETSAEEGVGWQLEMSPDTDWAELVGSLMNGGEEWLRKYLWQVWLRHRRLPWCICENKRLYLREFAETDLPYLREFRLSAFRRKDEGEDLRLIADKLEAYQERMYGFYGFGIWLVMEKESGLPVGQAGLQLWEGSDTPELGYEILPAHRRKGYAQEALEAVLHYAKEELALSRIRAVIEKGNLPSRKLCEKLSFYPQEKIEEMGMDQNLSLVPNDGKEKNIVYIRYL